MDKRDYLYHYTEIFFSEVVKETILIENWEEKDFDHRYIEYADIFLKMKDKCLAGNFTDKEIEKYLYDRRGYIVGLFNKKMLSHFHHEFVKRGYDKKSIDKYIPSSIVNNDAVNVDILNAFRKIEEQTFDNKQGEM